MSTPLTEQQLMAIEARSEAAYEEVSEISLGKRRWTMTVPAREGTDSDLVISNAIGDVSTLLAEIKRLKTRLAAAEMVCLAYGAAPAETGSDRQKALFELWWEWTEIAQPDHSVKGPLTDGLIRRLAARRDEKRAAALAGLQKLVGGEPGC